MNAETLTEKLAELAKDVYLSIHAEADRLFRGGKGWIDENWTYGKVFIVELDVALRLKEWKVIRGVGEKDNILYLYIQDTSAGMNNDALSGCDYIVPFTEVPELNLYLLRDILKGLEQV